MAKATTKRRGGTCKDDGGTAQASLQRRYHWIVNVSTQLESSSAGNHCLPQQYAGIQTALQMWLADLSHSQTVTTHSQTLTAHSWSLTASSNSNVIRTRSIRIAGKATVYISQMGPQGIGYILKDCFFSPPQRKCYLATCLKRILYIITI